MTMLVWLKLNFNNHHHHYETIDYRDYLYVSSSIIYDETKIYTKIHNYLLRQELP